MIQADPVLKSILLFVFSLCLSYPVYSSENHAGCADLPLSKVYKKLIDQYSKSAFDALQELIDKGADPNQACYQENGREFSLLKTSLFRSDVRVTELLEAKGHQAIQVSKNQFEALMISIPATLQALISKRKISQKIDAITNEKKTEKEIFADNLSASYLSNPNYFV